MKANVRVSYIETVILGMMFTMFAVNVAPRLAQAGTEGKISDLIDALEQMRSMLDLYQAEHDGHLPPSDSFVSFEAAMTRCVGRYGPYVKKMPINPFNNLNTVRFDDEPAGLGKAGWRLDIKTGLFQIV